MIKIEEELEREIRQLRLQVESLSSRDNPVGVPTNVIAFFTSSTPPSGWVEYTAARGRFIVGVPSAGTIAGTIGTALTNLQDKTHTHTGPSHTHTGPSHQHNLPFDTNGSTEFYWRNGGGSAFTDTHRMAVNIAAESISRTGAISDAGGTGATGAEGTGATGTAATSNVAPYIQLFTIQKS